MQQEILRAWANDVTFFLQSLSERGVTLEADAFFKPVIETVQRIAEAVQTQETIRTVYSRSQEGRFVGLPSDVVAIELSDQDAVDLRKFIHVALNVQNAAKGMYMASIVNRGTDISRNSLSLGGPYKRGEFADVDAALERFSAERDARFRGVTNEVPQGDKPPTLAM